MGTLAMGNSLFQFGEGFCGPSAGVEKIDGLAGDAKIHWRQRELRAASALHKDHGIVIGNCKVLAQAGFRVPTVIVSPFAPRNHVAHEHFDHTSILKLVEWRWGLKALTP